MIVGVLLAQLIPLAMMAAVSPVVFVNSTRLTAARGARLGLAFTLGGGAVLLVLGSATMGLMGAASSAWVQAAVVSRGVDAVLGLLLVGYGAHQVYEAQRARREDHAAAAATVPDTTLGAAAMGVLGMATNFTTLPLLFSIAQRLGHADLLLVVKAALLLVLILVILTPAWGPVALSAVRARGLVSATPRPRPSPQVATRRALLRTAGSWVGIGACLVGGVLLLVHAAAGGA